MVPQNASRNVIRIRLAGFGFMPFRVQKGRSRDNEGWERVEEERGSVKEGKKTLRNAGKQKRFAQEFKRVKKG